MNLIEIVKAEKWVYQVIRHKPECLKWWPEDVVKNFTDNSVLTKGRDLPEDTIAIEAELGHYVEKDKDYYHYLQDDELIELIHVTECGGCE